MKSRIACALLIAALIPGITFAARAWLLMDVAQMPLPLAAVAGGAVALLVWSRGVDRMMVGLDALYPGAANPFPWMSEMIDLKTERNFFETRVIEYQTGGALSWD